MRSNTFVGKRPHCLTIRIGNEYICRPPRTAPAPPPHLGRVLQTNAGAVMAHDRGSVDGSFRIGERMLRRADSEAKRVTGPKGRTRDNVVEYNRPRVVIPARGRVARVFLFQSKPSSVFVSSILGYGPQFLPAKIRRRIENLDRIFRPIRVRNVTFLFFCF